MLAWTPEGSAGRFIAFLSDPNIALGAAVLVGILTLGKRQDRTMDDVMKGLGAAVGSVTRSRRVASAVT